jgi:putative acetyltransferase
MPEQWSLRPIRPGDDAAIANVIRAVMTEFGCTGSGFAIHDAEVDRMSAAYGRPGSAYYVVEIAGQVLGGGGFGPLAGAAPETGICELRKMYFQRSLRGCGAGRGLLTHLLHEMQACGYGRCYLETVSGMDAARKLYLAAGFREIPGPRGCTGHHGCDRFFEREL